MGAGALAWPGNVEVWPADRNAKSRARSHAYVLGRERLVLVEPACGEPEEQAAWIAWGLRARDEGRRVEAIVLTHYHDDHTHGVEVVADGLGLPVLGPRELGDEIGEGWRVLDTPGHADEHVSLFDGRTLVAGDALTLGDGSAHEFLDTLARLADLDPPLLLPAHGRPVVGCARPLIRWRLTAPEQG